MLVVPDEEQNSKECRDTVKYVKSDNEGRNKERKRENKMNSCRTRKRAVVSCLKSIFAIQSPSPKKRMIEKNKVGKNNKRMKATANE